MVEVEKILRSYKRIQQQIDQIEYRLYKLSYNPMMGAPREIVSPSGIKVNGGRQKYGFMQTLEAIEDDYNARKEKYENILKALNDEAEWILDQVNAAPLTELEYEYTTLRYFEGLPIDTVCAKCYISRTTSWRIRNNIVKKLEYLKDGTQ